MVIVGTGPSEPYLKRLASDLRISPRITFLPQLPTPALHRWYKSCSVYLSLSRHESFGITLLEAIAAGATVIATAIPASTEVAQLTRTKVHFVPLDASPDHVAQTIRRALDARQPAPDLSRLPTWHSLSAECFRIYRDILTVAPSPLFAS
jgi:glycosyltransferase involved in cell wall biosynthesis